MHPMLDQLSPELMRVLRSAVQLAPAPIWLVGGLVRDLLLGKPVVRDLDLAIEAPVEQLATQLAAALGGRVLAMHAAFGTATIELDKPPLLIDLARARAERYPRPAALPEVRPASMAEDLFRRDFTLNALAAPLALSGDQLVVSELLDPYGGLADLRDGLLRVIHPASFRDDPTRILRGLRLAARLGLGLAPATRQALDQALQAGYLGLLSAERVRNELCLALDEPRPDAVLALSDTWGVTPQIHPELRWSAATQQRFAQLPNPQHRIHNAQPAALAAGLLTYDMPAAARDELVARYRLPNSVGRPLHELGAARLALASIGPELTDSAIDKLLGGFNVEALVVVNYAEQPPACDLIARYLAEIRRVTPLLNGADLRALGVAPGPMLGRLLADLRAARIDGLVASRDDELAWVAAQNLKSEI